MRIEEPFGDDNFIYTDIDSKSGYMHQFKVPYEIELTSCIIIDVIDVEGEPFIEIDITDTEAAPTLNSFVSDAAKTVGYEDNIELDNLVVPVNRHTSLVSTAGQDLWHLDPMKEHDMMRFTQILCDITINWAGFNIDDDGKICLDVDVNEIIATEPVWSDEDFGPLPQIEEIGMHHILMQNSNVILPNDKFPELNRVYPGISNVSYKLVRDCQ